MDATRANAKIFASTCDADTAALIATFHRWIQQQRLAPTQLLDVADYSHVHDGPGVLLVAHEAYWGIDRGEGRVGMLVRRRLGEVEAAERALAGAIEQALLGCSYLEQDLPGAIAFDTSEIVVGFDDRLRAPNDASTFAALEPTLHELATRLRPDSDALLERAGTPRGGFRARIRYPDAAPLADLLGRLKPAGAVRKLRIM